jgi:hypothetical protein
MAASLLGRAARSSALSAPSTTCKSSRNKDWKAIFDRLIAAQAREHQPSCRSTPRATSCRISSRSRLRRRARFSTGSRTSGKMRQNLSLTAIAGVEVQYHRLQLSRYILQCYVPNLNDQFKHHDYQEQSLILTWFIKRTRKISILH